MSPMNFDAEQCTVNVKDVEAMKKVRTIATDTNTNIADVTTLFIKKGIEFYEKLNKRQFPIEPSKYVRKRKVTEADLLNYAS